MLDDLAYIHEKDAEDALGVVEKQAAQLQHNFSLSGNGSFKPVNNIVYAGMGGSAIAALMAQSWPPISVPFTVVRNYDLLDSVNERTLVVCSSCSGNTEETLEALSQAEKKGAQIAIITGGGKLQKIGEDKGYPMLVIPLASQPRYSVLANFKALLVILEKAGVVISNSIAKDVEDAAAFLDTETGHWRADIPIKSNPAKQVAQELMGKSVVIYSGPRLAPAAYKWKIGINENAKHVAWFNQFPEFNHNEFIGWSKQPTNKPYAIIELRSNLEHPRVQKRFDVTSKLLSGMRPDPMIVQVQGKSVLEQILWASALGDFVSIYLAILNGINPSPVDLIEKFKKALDS